MYPQGADFMPAYWKHRLLPRAKGGDGLHWFMSKFHSLDGFWLLNNLFFPPQNMVETVQTQASCGRHFLLGFGTVGVK